MIRAFAAIPVPEDVTDALEVVQDDLPVGRPVLPENMHITLVFLGDVREPDLEEVHLAFETVRARPFEVALSGLGQFGGAAPRLIYAAVADNPALRHLHAKLEQAVRGAGLEISTRRFVSHVSIARLEGRREDAGPVGSFVSRRSMLSPPPFAVDAFCLYRSHLSRDDPIYEELARYRLAD